MKDKIRNITVTYPKNMEELTKNYSKSLARILVKIVSPNQLEGLIKKLEEKSE